MRSDVGGIRTLRLAVDARVLLVSVFNFVMLGAVCLVMAELLIPGVVNAATSGIASHAGPLPL